MLKCSKEAFAACPDRKGCGCLEEATFTEGSECDMFNRQIRSKPMTHGDQIRAMSDEELEWVIDPAIVPPGISKREWLQQPAKVSGEEKP